MATGLVSRARRERNAKFRQSPIKPRLLLKELTLLAQLRRSSRKGNASIQQFNDAGLWKDGNGVAAGHVIRFTFDEYQNVGATMQQTNSGFAQIHPRVLCPIDAGQEQIDAHLKEWQRGRKALAKRQRTAERNRTVVHLVDCRSSAIALALKNWRWQTTAELMLRLQGCPAFGKLTGNSLRVAILRELRSLESRKMIEMRTRKTKYRPDVIYVRLRTGDARCHSPK